MEELKTRTGAEHNRIIPETLKNVRDSLKLHQNCIKQQNGGQINTFYRNKTKTRYCLFALENVSRQHYILSKGNTCILGLFWNTL